MLAALRLKNRHMIRSSRDKAKTPNIAVIAPPSPPQGGLIKLRLSDGPPLSHVLLCTCMPHTRTPRVAEVLCSHFLICLAAFSSEASSPCCRVPIFRSRMQG